MAIVLVRKASYNYPELKPVFFEIIEALAGEKIKPGCRVLIKPNMLSAAAPENAILTHPLIIKAAVEYVLEKGARPRVSDSPAIGSFARIIKMNKIDEALTGLDVICSPFKNTVLMDIGKPYGKIEIAREAVEADIIINLPKLKTHTQMLLTLSVKNMFGCIVGFKKSQWHMRVGSDTDAFARLLIAIHQTVRPTVSILDGILALEGEGPGRGGKTCHIGVLMGSDDSFALDMTVCKMFGVSYQSAPILKNAAVLGLLPAFKVTGELPLLTGFQLPPSSGIIFGPRFLHNFMRRHTMALPVCDESLCEMCSQCWTLCPAKAMEELAEKIKFDYKKCIRCYCCIEICPYGALHAEETTGGKITRKLMEKFS